MGARGQRYLAYLLRLWQVQDQEKNGWRVSLEHAHTGERHGFPDLESLLALLKAETEKAELGDDPAPDIQHPGA